MHRAPTPQDPKHGSRHFCRIHACEVGHSELIVHSGLQLGGLPTKLGIHVQEGTLRVS